MLGCFWTTIPIHQDSSRFFLGISTVFGKERPRNAPSLCNNAFLQLRPTTWPDCATCFWFLFLQLVFWPGPFFVLCFPPGRAERQHDGAQRALAAGVPPGLHAGGRAHGESDHLLRAPRHRHRAPRPERRDRWSRGPVGGADEKQKHRGVTWGIPPLEGETTSMWLRILRRNEKECPPNGWWTQIPHLNDVQRVTNYNSQPSS